jgi:alkanesulfonate monooxygenase SsuD/methylene tetrahydromethanopterin reductase-like flavin-dependent oxidoreductase (luciferase family)
VVFTWLLEQFGTPQEKLLGKCSEHIMLWQEAFKGERFDFDGQHWNVEQGLLAPQP